MGNADIDRSKMYIDFDFPAIAPQDAVAMAGVMQTACTIFPEFADSEDIQIAALIAMGINDPNEVIDELEKIRTKKEKERAKNSPPEPPTVPAPTTQPPEDNQGAPAQTTPEEATATLITALRKYRESLNGDGHKELVNTEKEV